VNPVRVVGLVRRGTEPEIVVEFRRDGLRHEVRAPAPVELPSKPGGLPHVELQGPAQHAAVHQFLDRSGGGAEAVETVLESEPGVQAEDPAVALHGLGYSFSFADGAGHGFLAPDVLARFRGRGGDQPVPVRGRGDMHDVDIGPGQHFAEIPVPFDVRVHRGKGLFQVPLIDVADSQQPRTGVAEVAAAHAAHADHRLGQFFAGRGITFSAQDAPRHDQEGGRGGRALQKRTPGYEVLLSHGITLLLPVPRGGLNAGNVAAPPSRWHADVQYCIFRASGSNRLRLPLFCNPARAGNPCGRS